MNLVAESSAMAGNPVTYEWECPLCGKTSIGLSHGRGAPVANEAENAILSHVQRTGGDGHGEEGELPGGFDAVALTENVRFKEQYGSQASEGAG